MARGIKTAHKLHFDWLYGENVIKSELGFVAKYENWWTFVEFDCILWNLIALKILSSTLQYVNKIDLH